MSISSETVSVRYLGNNSTDTYSFNWKIYDEADLVVKTRDRTTNASETLLVLNTDYTVTGVGEASGSITLTAGNLADDIYLNIRLDQARVQNTVFRNQRRWLPNLQEDSFDKMVRMNQEDDFRLNQSVRVPETINNSEFNPELPTDIIDKPQYLLRINDTGDGFALQGPLSGLKGDFSEYIDNTDYTSSPNLSEYDWNAFNKIIFNGGGIAEIRSLRKGAPGQRMMLTNAQVTAINIINEDPGQTGNTRISTGTGGNINFPAGSTLFFNYDGNTETWRIVGGAAGAGNLLGAPTDGSYGGAIGPIAGIQAGDSAEDAFDKVDTILGLLAPQPPDPLSSKTLELIGAYTARQASTGTLVTDGVTDDTTPQLSPGLTSTLADSFRTGDSGVLSAEMDAVEIGSITLSDADDTGTDGELQILDDFDPYDGVFGQAGFWKGLTARINSATLAIGEHDASLIHSETGQVDKNFFVESPSSPSITGVSSGITGTAYKSGVPYANGTVNVQFDVDSFCSDFYNPTKIAAARSSQTNSVNAALGGPYSSGDTFNANINLSINSGQYTEGLTIVRAAYNSKDDETTSNLSTSIRIDTNGTESRVLSGNGQYPGSGYGGAFNSTTDVLSGNRELQFLNGRYQYPPAVDYSSNVPAGPDYSSLTPDGHNSMRWATFSLGSISAATSITFSFSGTQNFGGSTIISGFELYLRVDGATPTSGWLDANAAYPGVGNPTNNGDAALDVGASTATSKRVTFGAATKTGTVYVRIGIPSGSNKRFSGVS